MPLLRSPQEAREAYSAEAVQQGSASGQHGTGLPPEQQPWTMAAPSKHACTSRIPIVADSNASPGHVPVFEPTLNAQQILTLFSRYPRASPLCNMQPVLIDGQVYISVHIYAIYTYIMMICNHRALHHRRSARLSLQALHSAQLHG